MTHAAGLFSTERDDSIKYIIDPNVDFSVFYYFIIVDNILCVNCRLLKIVACFIGLQTKLKYKINILKDSSIKN